MGRDYKLDKRDKVLTVLAAILFLVAGYYLFFHEPDYVGITNAVEIGKLKPTQGFVRRRHARNLNWRTLKDSETLYLKDIVYVPKGMMAEIELAGKKKLTLESDTMVQFDEMTMDGIEITLFDGHVKGAAAVVKRVQEIMPVLLPRKKTQMANQLTGLDALALRSSELQGRGGDFYQRLKNRRAVQTITAPRPLALNRLEDYVLEPIRPKGGTNVVSGRNWIELTWTQVPLDGVEYVVQIAKDDDFEKFIRFPTTKQKTFIKLGASGTFYWRVVASLGKEKATSVAENFKTTVTRAKRLPAGLPEELFK